ncbi:tRNA uridine-5-carboxymethylaminomethyl(34) synthesis enzyme MnmG [Salipiger sp. IMCC34102]|uniref:tRNA uridine-5-carboxymethylaminomethyl(34) synthesis enzyme MnmG n=1 Tax=Salipiger sp. IMCC34102 TaxID=2510647 RepID=UPI00101CFD08|nr:tRNA uridine-5-carboxymethylaminomethyl(34) synthesis enzyme MnmG [Salipiger sp. IMCC34102]RYH04214.1 tRNA uridine-5-carboxymethylaminomethyl(34) synthesis enzyme MnmG [Salipiger sp. IMCC34102]
MFHVKHFEVIVIGAGHAGCEAALASARTGCTAALVTMKASDIGVMSCNPAIGGLGKGHLVREIDALGGAMGLAADASGIQFRLLNRTKGPAVRGPRTQSDRALYQQAMQQIVAEQDNLTLIEGEVTGLLFDGDVVCGIRTASEEMHAATVVLTTGTFLGGVIHIGDRQLPGGRIGAAASTEMAQQLRGMDLPIGRLKTGTPPRLASSSIDWNAVGRQEADEEPSLFSFLSTEPGAKQIACGVTETNSRTHEIIVANLSRSAMYGGHIDGVGPRYCPSIEDKVTRFADKDSHLVFLEPEGLNSDVVYPNGISTSLPEDVQNDYVHSMKGLEDAKILQPGYAIEYDYIDPRALHADFSLKACPNLYLAGQINGTTGYEEAAGQGLVAGLNAARKVKRQEPYIFSRTDSYLGVMNDDLTKMGVTEPYRMFTSRAEYRLLLRADNADRRLTPIGRTIGLVSDERWDAFTAKRDQIEAGQALLSKSMIPAEKLADRGVRLNRSAPTRSAADALTLADMSFKIIRELVSETASIPNAIGEQLRNDALYATYAERQQRDAAALQALENEPVPHDFNYDVLSGLSNELKSKIARAKPRSMYEVSRIEGMTPAALLLIRASVKKDRRAHAG